MSAYWTVEIPYQEEFASRPFMPTDATGPFRVLTRGAFATNSEAVDWAKAHLPRGAKVRFRQVKP